MSIPADSLGFLLADISRLMRRAYSQHLDTNQLTLAQSRVLVYLSRHQGLRQVELAELLEIQPITLTRQLETLTTLGLIERQPDARDKRAYQWYLTPAATPQLAAISDSAERIKQQALAGLSEQQAEQLTASLRQVRDNLSSSCFPEASHEQS
ncbi:MarR family transcriptional regulator [Oceanisphaera profunda]|uniref:MarR family transcriptional regulator n=1 Tax=Oceanisphaera profunda TaxID=1416627 RepID=A0A1Y0D6M4_9GAMM|nr:MarR family winged helix-turn-helix transcriptional regulator [Oceanisphaera profunda]ART83191.1 MarR family transcriptional regulator [Oceanisphaera profunda]